MQTNAANMTVSRQAHTTSTTTNGELKVHQEANALVLMESAELLSSGIPRMISSLLRVLNSQTDISHIAGPGQAVQMVSRLIPTPLSSTRQENSQAYEQ